MTSQVNAGICTWRLNNFHHSFVLYVDGAFNIYSIQDWLPKFNSQNCHLGHFHVVHCLYICMYVYICVTQICTLLFFHIYKSNEIDRDKINRPSFVWTHLQFKKFCLFLRLGEYCIFLFYFIPYMLLLLYRI